MSTHPDVFLSKFLGMISLGRGRCLSGLRCFPHNGEDLSLDLRIHVQAEFDSTHLYSEHFHCEMEEEPGRPSETRGPASLVCTGMNNIPVPATWKSRADTRGSPLTPCL